MARIKTPALAWLGVGLVLVVVQRVSNAWYEASGRWGWPGGDRFFAGWWQFDAGEFTEIARVGYEYTDGARNRTSFFPLFPVLIRAVRPLTGSELVGGVLVSALAGLGAVVLFWVWTDRWSLAAPVRLLALWIVVLYPWAWFLYGVPFADGLFVALVIGAFVLVERDRLLAAGIIGALATATRPTGLFLAPALVLLACERAGSLAPRPLPGGDDPPDADGGAPDRPGWWARLRLPVDGDRAAFRGRQLWPLLAFAGVGAYSAYLGARFDRPLVWITDQSLYNGTGVKTWLKAGLVDGWLHWDDPWRTVAQTLAALLALAVLLAVPAMGRRFGWGYGLWCLALVAMPALATRDFNSTGRYLLAAFPAVVVLAERLASGRPAVRWAWLAVSAGLLVAFDAAFARSRMVS